MFNFCPVDSRNVWILTCNNNVVTLINGMFEIVGVSAKQDTVSVFHGPMDRVEHTAV